MHQGWSAYERVNCIKPSVKCETSRALGEINACYAGYDGSENIIYIVNLRSYKRHHNSSNSPAVDFLEPVPSIREERKIQHSSNWEISPRRA